MTEPSRDDDLQALTFEQIVQRLEETIGRMASGDLGIEEVTDLYERAGRLHDAAAQRLVSIEERLAKLTESSGSDL
jgi:exodeoxyribonuclease VII small subunit